MSSISPTRLFGCILPDINSSHVEIQFIYSRVRASISEQVVLGKIEVEGISQVYEPTVMPIRDCRGSFAVRFVTTRLFVSARLHRILCQTRSSASRHSQQ